MTMMDCAVARDSVAAGVERAADLRRQGEMKAALACLLDLLEKHGGDPLVRLELATVLEATGRAGQARTIFAQLARQADGHSQTWDRLAAFLVAEGHEAAARACLQRAQAHDPASVEVRRALAGLLARQGDAIAAEEAWRLVLALVPLPEAHAGLADALAAQGRCAEAAEEYSRALALDEDNPAARYGRARLGWRSGELTDAWPDWEERWRAVGIERPAMPGARWAGGDCAGSTVLLFAEHFLADAIQFVRYAPLVRARGGRVVLAVPAALAPLMAGVEGVEQVLVQGEPVPAELGLDFDLNASLLDLPALFDTALDTIPRLPYLSPPVDRRRPVEAPPNTLMKVGLAWIGERAEHQIPFGELMPLLTQPAAAFYALQTGPRAGDAVSMAHPALIRDLSPTIGDFADLAARIWEMDLVITADSVVAHLAGAMGRPTWLLLPAYADPRWMDARDDSPWYPSMRLFRQGRSGDWAGVVTRVLSALENRLADADETPSGGPPVLSVSLLGTAAAQRALLAAHLVAGDLFIDIGPGDGRFTFDAAGHASGDVRVLAFEPRPAEAALLADSATASGVGALVEVVPAAAGDRAGRAMIATESRRGGFRLVPVPDWVSAPIPVVPVDVTLADRPHLAGRRLMVRLGDCGGGEAALRGLWGELALFHVAAVVFEHRAGSGVAALLGDAGYQLFVFPGPEAAGSLVAFADRPGVVLALAPDCAPAASYGDDPSGPPPAKGDDEAARLVAEAVAAQQGDDLPRAAQLYTQALAREPTNFDANANLAVVLRRQGRRDAAVVCSRRALALRGVPAVWANLGNALRDLGRFGEAEAALMKAGEGMRDDPDLIYNLALLEKARGRGREAGALMLRSLVFRPDAARQWELGKMLLKLGDVQGGFALSAFRPRAGLPPTAGKPWDGEDCAGCTMLVRDEADASSTMLLARFLPHLARRGALVTVECEPALSRLLAGLPGVEAVVARGEPLPDCEFQVGLGDLPRLLATTADTLPRQVPYLHSPAAAGDFQRSTATGLRVGLTWAGRPGEHYCPLVRLLPLAAVPGVALVSVQGGPWAADLGATGAHAFIDDWSGGWLDLADLAQRIAAVDLLITGDSVEAHLAAAMGRPVWVVLPAAGDWCWPDGRDSTPWYPTVRLFRQSADGGWDHAVQRMADTLAVLAAAKMPPPR